MFVCMHFLHLVLTFIPNYNIMVKGPCIAVLKVLYLRASGKGGAHK